MVYETMLFVASTFRTVVPYEGRHAVCLRGLEYIFEPISLECLLQFRRTVHAADFTDVNRDSFRNEFFVEG